MTAGPGCSAGRSPAGAAVGVATLSGIVITAAGAEAEVDFTTAFLAGAALVALVLSLVPADRGQRRSARP